MKRGRVGTRAIVSAVVLAGLCVGVARSSASGTTPAYSFSDLGTVAVDFKFCTYTSGANGVNNRGVAVGWSTYSNNCDDSPRGTLTVGGVFKPLPRIPVDSDPWFQEAIAINDHGQSVGWSNLQLNLFTPRVAFVSSGGPAFGGGTTTILPELCGASCSPDRYGAEARDINTTGHIVGFSDTAAGARHAFLYAGGILRDLGTLSGGTSAAYGINDADQVVGASDGLAFLWNGAMSSLGTLGGATSTATAINNARQVVGYSDTAGGSVHGFLYAGGKMTDLGTLGGTWSKALDINRYGQVVGLSATAGDSAVDVFTWADGVMQDVATLLPPGTDFRPGNEKGSALVTGPGLGINNVGQIAGARTCTLDTCFFGQHHGALLTDTVAPACAAGPTGTTATGNKFLTATVQDLGSGLRAVHVISATNATVQAPAFRLATPRQIDVKATQSSKSSGFTLQLLVTDIAGNQSTCTFSQPA